MTLEVGIKYPIDALEESFSRMSKGLEISGKSVIVYIEKGLNSDENAEPRPNICYLMSRSDEDNQMLCEGTIFSSDYFSITSHILS